MLLAPGSLLSLYYDLAFENTFSAPSHRGLTFLLESVVSEIIRRSAVYDIVEDRNGSDHGAIVEGDPARVSWPERIELRPATAWILCFE